MKTKIQSRSLLALAVIGIAGAVTAQVSKSTAPAPVPAAAQPKAAAAVIMAFPGTPPVTDATNLYSNTAASNMSAATEGALPRVYVPNRGDNTVSVLDPVSLKVLSTFKVGIHPQHVVPSWDMRTLWVANNAEGRKDGSLTPIDPKTAKPGASIPVDDPYNMYWTPDGKFAIIVAEAYKRLDFRDPVTMKIAFTIPTPKCAGKIGRAHV